MAPVSGHRDRRSANGGTSDGAAVTRRVLNETPGPRRWRPVLFWPFRPGVHVVGGPGTTTPTHAELAAEQERPGVRQNEADRRQSSCCRRVLRARPDAGKNAFK